MAKIYKDTFYMPNGNDQPTASSDPVYPKPVGKPRGGSVNPATRGVPKYIAPTFQPIAPVHTPAPTGGSAGGTASPTPAPTSPGQSTVTTSINPSPIYTPTMTQQAVNQAMATAAQRANPYFAQKQFDSPGMSRTAGSMAAAMPSIADALAQGHSAATALPFADAAANAAHMLAGQSAQDQEGLGLAGINQSLSEMQQNFNNSQKQQQMSLLMQLLQGVMGQMGGLSGL